MEHYQIFDSSNLTPKSFASCLASLIVFAILSKLVYNVYFHPLAAYPGPLSLVISDIPLACYALLGISHYRLKEAHEKYGQVVRVAPGTLSYIKPEAWNDIYGHKKDGGGRAQLPKDPLFYNEMLMSKDAITHVNDDDAIPIRRSLNSAFAHRSLLEQEPMMQRHIGQLIEQLEERSKDGTPVDMQKWLTFSMFDINSEFGFGDDMGCVKAGAYHQWVEFVLAFFYAATVLHQCHKFWPLNRVLALCMPPSMRKMQTGHNEVSLERARKRIASKTDKHDFMYYFMQQAKKENLSTKTIEAQASVLILAGSEPSAVAEVAVIHDILSHPGTYQKVRDEVRSLFSTVDAIRLIDVTGQLPYLDAVLKESLRLHPPLPNGLTRWVSEKDGAFICGQHVPFGTVVSVNHYCASTSPTNFRNPEAFAPERWMGDPKYADDNRHVVQPFSVGPRNCPGQKFALYGIKLTLAHLLWRFDLSLGEGTDRWAIGQRVYNGWIQPPLPIILKKRPTS
ncbi:cytochrome P450 [Stachybotrys elegans]|uniref:Cytochrome P450 n=1 Tax=Stachybotrys elegans TaxID=80388 RepID=A0A8K0STU8_9HYPO|nr:cytochrome P450 [Stachybotrys elegans]